MTKELRFSVSPFHFSSLSLSLDFNYHRHRHLLETTTRQPWHRNLFEGSSLYVRTRTLTYHNWEGAYEWSWWSWHNLFMWYNDMVLGLHGQHNHRSSCKGFRKVANQEDLALFEHQTYCPREPSAGNHDHDKSQTWKMYVNWYRVLN